MTTPPSANDFRVKLRACFEQAEQAGESTLEVNAGQLHREVGGYPTRSGNHRMRTCCLVMMSEKVERDRIRAMPPSGWGASLTIRYRLPREHEESERTS